jgi:hypothetical protein
MFDLKTRHLVEQQLRNLATQLQEKPRGRVGELTPCAKWACFSADRLQALTKA